MTEYTGPVLDGLCREASTHYRRLKGRGGNEMAAKLADLGITEQPQFVKNQVVDFDPEHVNPANQEMLKVKNIYDALLELGHTDRAEELRGFILSGEQVRRAKSMVEAIGAEVDTETGESDRPNRAAGA